jgi:hypothetical protein
MEIVAILLGMLGLLGVSFSTSTEVDEAESPESL